MDMEVYAIFITPPLGPILRKMHPYHTPVHFNCFQQSADSQINFFFYVFRVRSCKHLAKFCAVCLAHIMYLFLTLTIFSGTTIMQLLIV
jgi:hypothetical protein